MVAYSTIIHGARQLTPDLAVINFKARGHESDDPMDYIGRALVGSLDIVIVDCLKVPFPTGPGQRTTMVPEGVLNSIYDQWRALRGLRVAKPAPPPKLRNA